MLSFPLVTESTNRSSSSRRKRRRSNDQPRLTGKSTLTQLLQMLYTPERGRILIDGIDITLLDPSWLRRQIGVVLQENVLFNRSIRDNIALADPTMPLEKVIAAAELAGADEMSSSSSFRTGTITFSRSAAPIFSAASGSRSL
jgi:ATP-binding cassette, subfamily B, bacterial HlyB/CyaB